MTMAKKQLLIEGIAGLLMLLFLYASISKFLDFKTFTGEIRNQPLPRSWIPFLIWGIPLLEVAISVALLFEYTRLPAFYVSLTLMSLFTIYAAAILLHFFPRIPCSCGGVIRKLTWRQHLVLNLFFVAISALGIRLQRSKHVKSIFITNKNSFV
jgi:putative oxidoreductase